jgi:isoleucyl-tRNA synthetase
MLAPIIPHTAEEVYAALKDKKDRKDSIFLEDLKLIKHNVSNVDNAR